MAFALRFLSRANVKEVTWPTQHQVMDQIKAMNSKALLLVSMVSLFIGCDHSTHTTKSNDRDDEVKERADESVEGVTRTESFSKVQTTDDDESDAHSETKPAIPIEQQAMDLTTSELTLMLQLQSEHRAEARDEIIREIEKLREQRLSLYQQDEKGK